MVAIAKYRNTKRESTRSAGLKRSYSLEWIVKFDGVAVESDVYNAPFVPLIYGPFPLDPGAVCKSKRAVKVPGGKGRIWTVSADYDNEPISKAESDREQYPNPLERPPEISWGYASFSRVLEKDVDDVLVATANGEPFDPPLEVDDLRPVLKIKRNQASFGVDVMLQYGNAINTDRFYGAAPRQAKMLPPTAAQRVEENQEFWEVNYEVHFSVDTWTAKVLHQGFKVKVGSLIKWATEKLQIGPDAGIDVAAQRPVLLKADGTRLEDGGTPVYKDFKRYREVAFAPLGLGG